MGPLRTVLRLQFAVLAVATLSSCLFSGGGDVDDDDNNNVNAVNPDQGQPDDEEACQVYCEVMRRNCNETFDDSGEFDEQACQRQCEDYPRVPVRDNGVLVPLGEPVANRNSLECRVYHAGLANRQKNGIHCEHAGPDGADTCVDSPLCEAFCLGGSSADGDFNGFVEVCAGTVAALDVGECLQFCSELREGTRGDDGGDTVHCRLFWATSAQDSPQLCPNAGRDSPICFDL